MILNAIILLCLLIANYNCETYEDNEALIMALEKSGTLLDPPIEMYQKIHNDLALIRTAYPVVANVRHTSSWVMGELLCQSVTRDAITKLNDTEYGPITERSLGSTSTYEVIHFSKKYNSPVLAKVLKAQGLLTNCQVDHVIGLSQSITINSDNRYTFYKGSGDCQSGCIDKHYWVFTVTDGKVKLESESGTGGSSLS